MTAMARFIRTFSAVFFVFLMLSARPIDAARTQPGTEGDLEAGSSLQQGGSSASCASLQEAFETRAGRVATVVGAGPNTTRTGMAAGILRTWGMTSALRRAKNQGCEWTEGGQVNTSALDHVVRQGLSGSACFPQAESMMRAAQGFPEAEQASQFFQAMSVLLSPSCNVTLDLETDEVPESGVGTEPVEFGSEIDGDADLEDQSDIIADGLDAAAAEGEELVGEDAQDEDQGAGESVGASFLQSTAGEDQFPHIISWGSSALGFLESSLPHPRWGGQRITTMVGGQQVTLLADPAGGWFLQGMLVALWVLAFAVTCYVLAHVVAMVVKMVLCILRWLFRVVITLGQRVWSLNRCILRTLFDALHGNVLNRPLKPLAAGACVAAGAGIVAVR